jgi:hypothetical protein
MSFLIDPGRLLGLPQMGHESVAKVQEQKMTGKAES